MKNNRHWVECFDNKSSFEWTFSLPITSENWKEKILQLDSEFLQKGKKYGLFYFEKDISKNYKEVRTKNFFKGANRRIELLGFENYFEHEDEGHIERMILDIPIASSEGIVNRPESIRRPFVNLRVLEINNSTGLYLDEVEDLPFGFEEVVYFTLSSSSNIWWDEISYREDKEGNVHKLSLPKNNRPWAYKISPRFNSLLRDLVSKTMELGGEVLLEEFNKKHVTDKGILLDGKILYHEDIASGSIDLLNI